MIERIYKITYWLFIVESVLLIVGLSQGILSYGVDIQTSLMSVAILLAIVIASGFRMRLRRLDNTVKIGVGLTLSAIMVFLCFYYVLEDQFQIML